MADDTSTPTSTKLTRTERNHFSQVKKAREALQARAFELFKLYLNNIKQAKKAGDFELVARSIQYLLEHTPADADGLTILEASIDKPKQVEGHTGPTINFGFAIGGLTQPKELPPAQPVIIDVLPNDTKDSK